MRKKEWSSSSGCIVIRMTQEQAESVSGSGQQDENVSELSSVPAIADQLAAIDADVLRRELKEYGAWDAEELADHEQNLQRLLWVAGCDVAEGNV